MHVSSNTVYQSGHYLIKAGFIQIEASNYASMDDRDDAWGKSCDLEISPPLRNQSTERLRFDSPCQNFFSTGPRPSGFEALPKSQQWLLSTNRLIYGHRLFC